MRGNLPLAIGVLLLKAAACTKPPDAWPGGAIPNEGEFLKMECGGRVEKRMPPWCNQGMSTAQIDTIYAYVQGRRAAKLRPGRPARRN